MKTDLVEKISKSEKEQLDKLHRIVQDSIEAEELIIQNLLNPPLEILTQGQKISDKVAYFGGSWKFIIFFGVFLTLWIIFNVFALGVWKFDPYPFILMNLILSCIAALQAPIIMMSQNRQSELDRRHAQSDYEINVKAELEIELLHEKIDLLKDKELLALTQAVRELTAHIQTLTKPD